MSLEKINNKSYEYTAQDGTIWTITNPRKGTWTAAQQGTRGETFGGTSLNDIKRQLEQMEGLQAGTHVLVSNDDLQALLDENKALRKANNKLQNENFNLNQKSLSSAAQAEKLQQDVFDLLRQMSQVERKAANEIISMVNDNPSQIYGEARIENFFTGRSLTDAIIRKMNEMN